MTPTIRFARPEDMNTLIDLCEAHAHYEMADYDKHGKAKGLARDLFTDNPRLFCLVVERDRSLIGYATYMKQYATWDASDYVYMDCLFVSEGQRGQGLGQRLMERIQEETRKLGCSLIQWQTPDFNTGAIRFYKRLGAHAKTKERFFLDA